MRAGLVPSQLVLDIGPAWVRLAAPALRELRHLVGCELPPAELLVAMEDCGLGLVPPLASGDGGGGSGNRGASSFESKDEAMERAMCEDVASIWWVAAGRWLAWPVGSDA